MNYKEWLAQAIADLAPKNPTENSKIRSEEHTSELQSLR